MHPNSRGKTLIPINICDGQGKTIVQMTAASYTYVLRKLRPIKGSKFPFDELRQDGHPQYVGVPAPPAVVPAL
jgi:hypothetical protein